VRMLLLLIFGAVFLTGLVWWVVFLGNLIAGATRKK
jgi:hypothetical protein